MKSLNIIMSSDRNISWWKCTLHCRGKFKKCQYLLLIIMFWSIMHSSWKDWKNTNQRQSQLKIEKKNHNLHKFLTLNAELLLPSFLIWTKNHRDLLLWPWRRVTTGNWRGLDLWYCATIVMKKNIFISIIHIHQRTILIKYRSLRHQTLTLPSNIQKT